VESFVFPFTSMTEASLVFLMLALLWGRTSHATLRAMSSRAAVALARWRDPEAEAARFADRRPPAFLFLHEPRSELARRCCGGVVKRSPRPRR
jgi:hypothetical protein